MRQFQQKKKVRSRLYSLFSIIFLIILTLLLTKAVFNIYLKELESEKVKQAALKNLNELNLRHEELSRDIENLKTSAGLEKEIRSKFSVVKEGEQVIVVVPADSASSTSEGEKNIFVKLWNKFLGIFN